MDLTDPTVTALAAADALERAGLPFALYGGLLLAAYGEPRETRDADFAVVDATATQALAALRATGIATTVAFEGLVLGGLVLDRLSLLGGGALIGLNTLDLVRPCSERYRAAALRRAPRILLRGREVPALSPEDFVLFKLLSTRERDLLDAASVLRRTGGLLDAGLLRREIDSLAAETPEAGIGERRAALVRLSQDPMERRLHDDRSGEVREMTPSQWKRLSPPARSRGSRGKRSR